MVIINHYIKSNHCEVEVKYAYTKDFKHLFHTLISAGYKYNNVRRTFNKFYYDVEYTMDRFDDDIKNIKNLFNNKYDYRCFKLIKEDRNLV